jgi:hypothetical protein
MEAKKRGGARAGAGRKPLKQKSISIRMYLQPDLYKKFRELGGQRWVRALLESK